MTVNYASKLIIIINIDSEKMAIKEKNSPKFLNQMT